MNKKIFAMFAVLVVIVVSGCTTAEKENDAVRSDERGGDQLTFDEKLSSGEVDIDLNPAYENGKLYVEAFFNTHTVTLTELNLMESVVLSIDGEEISPSEVPVLSGHHSGGNFVFDVEEQPESFSIIIKGIPDIEERILSWP